MPTLRDGTQPIIAHGSVYLRPAERADIPLFVRWFNDYGTSRTLAIRAPMSIPSEEQWFERAVADQGTDGYHFVTCLLADDRPIGTIGLFELDLVNGSAGLGISIGDPADRGQGYGTRHVQALLALRRSDSLRLERIWLDVYDFNAGAPGCTSGSGFVDEGVAPPRALPRGRHVDLFTMAILVDEWRASTGRSRGRSPGLTASPRRSRRASSLSSRSMASRNGSVTSSGSASRIGVLRAVGGPRAQRRPAQVGDVVVAEPVRQRLEVGDPARRAHGRAPRPASRSAARAATMAASSIAGYWWRAVPRAADRAAADRAGRVTGPRARRSRRSSRSAGRGPARRRLRSEPLTRMRNE